MKKHILLIDDDKNELTIFMDALRKVPHDDGFKCTYASSATHAIEMLKYLVPDYIFADFKVHETNGADLLGYIKGQERFEKTRLCLYLREINPETQSTATSIGAYHIQKTSTIDELTSGLSRFLDYRSEPEYAF